MYFHLNVTGFCSCRSTWWQVITYSGNAFAAAINDKNLNGIIKPEWVKSLNQRHSQDNVIGLQNDLAQSRQHILAILMAQLCDACEFIKKKIIQKFRLQNVNYFVQASVW